MVDFLKPILKDVVRHRYLYLILILLIALMALTLHSGGRGADGREYLRWSHSLVFDQDLHLLNNYEALGGGYQLTPTGFIFERVNVGAPLMWAPFYGLSFFFLSDPGALPETAYSAELVGQLWINFSSWLYPILGAILTLGALRRFFSPTVLGTAIIAVLLGTPVLFYMVTFPASSHPASIFLSALLLYLWLSDQPQSAPLSYFTLAVVVGWLMIVAGYNVVFLALPGLTLLQEFVARRNWRGLLINGLAVGLGGLVGFAPQMIVWWFLFGNPLYSPYSGQLLWTEPYLLATLFSTFHGLFFYAPLLLLVIPGLWWWCKRDIAVALSIGLVWLLLAYLASINVAWWAGASFGNRYFLTLTPFFIFGLAAFFQHSRRWGVALAGLCVLWTIGLYLQFLNGVGLTSDSIVYSVPELARGQLTAFSGVLSILPQLWTDRPWPWVTAAILPAFAFITILTCRLLYGWLVSGETGSTRPIMRLIVSGGSIVLIAFFAVAGFRGEQAKVALAEQGFYDQPHQVIRREIKELAGKAGLVTRALYHEQTGQPDKAMADLRLAAELWKRDGAPEPQRLYLGPKEAVSPDLTTRLHLDYPAQARLIGYQVHEANETFVSGELFWEKLPGDKSREVVTPVVRAFDASGAILGSTIIDFPFPAYYVPAGDLFKDRFRIAFDLSPGEWIWLDVSLVEDATLPINALGEIESGVIAPVRTGPAPVGLPAVVESEPGLIGKPLLLVDEAQPGAVIPLQFIWRSGEPLDNDPQLILNLSDPAGNGMAQESYNLNRPAHNVAGTSAASRVGETQTPDNSDDLDTISSRTYCFALPDTVSAGDYTLMASLQPAGAGYLLDAHNTSMERVATRLRLIAAQVRPSTTICNLIEADFPRSYRPAMPQHLLDVQLIDEIKLAGYDLFVVPQSNSVSASVVLYWTAQANVGRNYRVSVQLLDAAGQPLIGHSDVPKHGTRPTSTWLHGEWILDEHALELPVLAPGSYRLSVSLLDAQTGLPVEIGIGQTTLTLQDVQIP